MKKFTFNHQQIMDAIRERLPDFAVLSNSDLDAFDVPYVECDDTNGDGVYVYRLTRQEAVDTGFANPKPGELCERLLVLADESEIWCVPC